MSCQTLSDVVCSSVSTYGKAERRNNNNRYSRIKKILKLLNKLLDPPVYDWFISLLKVLRAQSSPLRCQSLSGSLICSIEDQITQLHCKLFMLVSAYNLRIVIKSQSLKNIQTNKFWRFALYIMWPYIGTFDILIFWLNKGPIQSQLGSCWSQRDT